MKKIKLTQNQYAIVDDEDFKNLELFNWVASKDKYGKYYATRTILVSEINSYKKSKISMHRYLLNPKIGLEVDHINGDTLDNRKRNLRICTRQQNNWNRVGIKNTSSKYKGVSFNKEKQRWTARIGKTINGKVVKKYGGAFDLESEAAVAYNKMATDLYGEYAFINKI